jgi:hypothetical protein
MDEPYPCRRILSSLKMIRTTIGHLSKRPYSNTLFKCKLGAEREQRTRHDAAKSPKTCRRRPPGRLTRRERHAALVSSHVIAGDRIDAEFLADMGELFRIGEAVIHHHRSQCR